MRPFMKTSHKWKPLFAEWFSIISAFNEHHECIKEIKRWILCILTSKDVKQEIMEIKEKKIRDLESKCVFLWKPSFLFQFLHFLLPPSKCT